jgi:integrase
MSLHRRRTKGGRVHWQVRWREGGRGGRNCQATFDRKRDAEVFETARRRAKQLGQLSAEVLGSEQPLADFISEWWETYAVVRLRPGTLESYAWQLDRWIIPFLGEIPLRNFTRATVDGYVAALVSAGAGAPTINRCLAITQGIFQRALQWGRIATNPVVGVARLQHTRDARIRAQPAETVEAIRGVLDRQNAALVSILAYEGLRPGEAFALAWQHVLDATKKPRERLLVERALSDHRLALTKSARVREPELFAPVAEELAALYVAAGEPEFHSLVFPDGRGGFLRRQNWRKRVWLPALRVADPCLACEATGRVEDKQCSSCEGAGTPTYFRPYDLRHTAATLLIYAGRTINEVAEHLGHADPGFTARTYTHIYREAPDHRGVPIEEVIRRARVGGEARSPLLSRHQPDRP